MKNLVILLFLATLLIPIQSSGLAIAETSPPIVNQGKSIKIASFLKRLKKRPRISSETKGILSIILGTLAMGTALSLLILTIMSNWIFAILAYMLTALFLSFTLVFGFSAKKREGKTRTMGIIGLIMAGITVLLVASAVLLLFDRIFDFLR